MDLHTPPSVIAQRLWRRLFALTLVHALVATVLVAVAYRVNTRPGHASTDMIAVWIAYGLWLVPIFVLRRSAIPLRTWRMKTSGIGCIAAFLPLLQVLIANPLTQGPDGLELLTLTIQGNALLLVWILISGICLLMIELPFPGVFWACLFGNVGIALVILAVLGMLRGI